MVSFFVFGQPAFEPASPVTDGNATLIYLEEAERLSFDQQRVPDGQLLTGNVRFRHGDALMYCDSAYFYRMTNSFRAFSNVRIVQGDTIALYGNRLDYDGNTMLAKMRDSVRMENRTTTLTTDTLYFDRIANIAYYHTGGKIEDELNSLTSLKGEYHPDTHLAMFKTDVRLANQNFEMHADTLHYNTENHVADIVGQTEIVYQGETTIRSTLGWYNTETEHSMLYRRSVVEHSAGQSLTGDTIFYDKRRQFGRVHGHMMLTDSTNHTTLCGNYGTYDQIHGSGMATDSAMAIDWTSADSLYIHADSMFIDRYKLPVEAGDIKADKPRRQEIDEVKPAVEDENENEEDVNVGEKQKSSHKQKDAKPVKEKKKRKKRRDTGPQLMAADSVAPLALSADSAYPAPAALLPDSVLTVGIGTAADTLTAVADTLKTFAPDSIAAMRPDSVVADSVEYNTMHAYWNVRLYRHDLQAICDSMAYDSRDSIMHLFREPILWNENNQITGDDADIYMANGTMDHAVITGKGIMMQKLDTVHYNQMQGKELVAHVRNKQLYRVDVNGNAETIFYPEDNEELVGVNKTQSSYVKIYFENKKIQRAVLTTLSEGTMYPLDQIEHEELYLTQFFWAEQERPKSKTDIFSPTVRTPKNTKKVVSAVSKDEDEEPEEDAKSKKDKQKNKRIK